MSPIIFNFLFLATGPIALMPSIIALFTRRTGRGWVLAGNVVLWTVGYFAARSVIEPSGSVHVSVAIALIGWIGLLAYSVRGNRAPTVQPADP